jgi:hypothetical protein
MSKFKNILVHLKNLTVDDKNATTATALANNKSAKNVTEYFKYLESIRLSEWKPITSVDDVFITVLAFIVIATRYFFVQKIFYSITQC